ncbi:hypothetical protein L7F22_045435 [Adiantum nelumboides]|nr:hypothetical protein [Adiantum nelumboides]
MAGRPDDVIEEVSSSQGQQTHEVGESSRPPQTEDEIFRTQLVIAVAMFTQVMQNPRFMAFLQPLPPSQSIENKKQKSEPAKAQPQLKYKGLTKSPKLLTIPTSATPSPSVGSSSIEHGEVVAKQSSLKPSNCAENLKSADPQSSKKSEGMQGHNEPSRKVAVGASQEPLLEPKYEIVYSNGLDLGKFWMDNSIEAGSESETPKEIRLRVLLPEVVTASEVELDVSDTQALLVVPALYKLQVKWRFTVDAAKGSAKFDKAEHKKLLTHMTHRGQAHCSIADVLIRLCKRLNLDKLSGLVEEASTSIVRVFRLPLSEMTSFEIVAVLLVLSWQYHQ